MDRLAEKELARDAPVAVSKAIAAVEKVTKGLKTAFAWPHPTKDDDTTKYKLLIARMSSSSSKKSAVWHKAKPAISQIDATCGGEEEEADTTTFGDVAFSKAPQPPAALPEPVEVKVAIKQDEVRDDEQSPAPLGFTKPKFSAESLIAKYETILSRIKALTFITKAPVSAPSWCALGDMATPELLDLLDTTQPASALGDHLRHLKAACTLKPLTVKISPMPGWATGKTPTSIPARCVLRGDVASPDLLAVIATDKPASLLRHLKAAVTPKTLHIKSRPMTGFAGKTPTSIPAWCVLGDVASPDLLAVIATKKPASGLRACTLRLKASCAPKQPKSTPTAACCASRAPKAPGRVPVLVRHW